MEYIKEVCSILLIITSKVYAKLQIWLKEKLLV